ncbi:MAG: hypothetical protein ACYTF6_11575 [Planctomycetota bacterium]
MSELAPSVTIPDRLQAWLETAGRRRWAVALAHGLFIAAALFPLLVVDVPALVDYPNHLARAHILATISDNPVLQERYVVEWKLVPNLAMDLFMVPLASFMSTYTAGRIFVAVTLLSIVAGTLTLHRVLHGRVGLWPAAVYLLVYNHVLAWGFLNNLFGFGICLFALAGWIATDRWPAWTRLAAFTALSSILFFSHLFAFGAYGLTIGAYQLGQFLARREWTLERINHDLVVPAGQFLLPCVLWLMSPGATGIVPGSSGVLMFGNLSSKFRSLWSPVGFIGDGFDGAVFFFACIALLILVLTRSLKMIPAMRAPILVLVCVAAALPTWVLSIVGVDFRLPLLIACLVVAGTRIEAKSLSHLPVIAIIALALFGERIWSTTETWNRYDRQFQEFRDASKKIDVGARVLVARLIEGRLTVSERMYSHMAALAVIERSVFLPDLFTGPQQPLGVTLAYAPIDLPNGYDLGPTDLSAGADPAQAEQLETTRLVFGSRAYFAHWPRRFDYVVTLDAEDWINPFPDLLRPVHQGSFFVIYAVKPGWPAQS